MDNAPSIKDQISSWDFFYPRKKLEKDGYKTIEIRQMQEAYVNFMYLIAKYPEEVFGPSEAVDKFWHLHILDTVDYQKFCNAIFGKYIHHNPCLEVGDLELSWLKNSRKRLSDLGLDETLWLDGDVAGFCGGGGGGGCGNVLSAKGYCGNSSDRPDPPPRSNEMN